MCILGFRDRVFVVPLSLSPVLFHRKCDCAPQSAFNTIKIVLKHCERLVIYPTRLQRYFFEINAALALQGRCFSLSTCNRGYICGGVFLILSYFVRYPEAHQNRTGGTSFLFLFFFFFQSNEPHSFFTSRSLARADRYVLHFSLALPFLPRTTRAECFQVFLLPLAPSFCARCLSLSFLPTDYAPVVDAHRRIVFLASLLPRLPPSSVSFPFHQWSGSKYTLSRGSLSLSPTILRLSLSSSAEVSLFLESSLFFRLSSIRFALSVSLFFPVPSPSILSKNSSSFYIVSQSFRFNSILLKKFLESIFQLFIAFLNICWHC